VSSTTGTTMSSMLSTSSTKVYDKHDLNKDGKITDAERLQYDIIHPPEKKKQVEKKGDIAGVQSYTQQGKAANTSIGKSVDDTK
jgi:hypothetical protein